MSDEAEFGRAHVGDRVEAVLKGRLIDYDAKMGKWTIETDGSDHIAWRIKLHWAQPFRIIACPGKSKPQK